MTLFEVEGTMRGRQAQTAAGLSAPERKQPLPV